jgi:drug/metabolite transporter (DMT)-like permease
MTAILSKIVTTNPTWAGMLLIALASLIWAVMETVVLHIPGDYSLYAVVWVRYGTHLLLMILGFGPLRGLKLIRTNRLGLQISRAVMMLIMPASFIVATDFMSVRNIMTIFWLAPLMITALAMVLLRERISWASWIVSIAGFLVFAVLANPNRHLTITGILLSLAMGLSFSLYPVMTRMLQGESALTNLFYTAAGVFLPLSVALPCFWKPLSVQAALMMSLVGLLGFAVLWVWEKALDLAPVSILAPIFFLEPIFMIIFTLVTKALRPA